MTVRFLTSWNGYSAGDRATLTNEAALISAGIARNDYVQDGASPLYPPNRDYAAAVVGAAGSANAKYVDSSRNEYRWSDCGAIRSIYADIRNPHSAIALTSVPARIGVNFRQGEVFSADQFRVRLSDGTIVAHQFEGAVHPRDESDISTWPDGSIRAGWVWVIVSLSAGQTKRHTIEVFPTALGQSVTQAVTYTAVSGSIDELATGTNGVIARFENSQGWMLRRYQDKANSNFDLFTSSNGVYAKYQPSTGVAKYSYNSGDITQISHGRIGSSAFGYGVVFQDYETAFSFNGVTGAVCRVRYRLFADGSLDIQDRLEYTADQASAAKQSFLQIVVGSTGLTGATSATKLYNTYAYTGSNFMFAARCIQKGHQNDSGSETFTVAIVQESASVGRIGWTGTTSINAGVTQRFYASLFRYTTGDEANEHARRFNPIAAIGAYPLPERAVDALDRYAGSWAATVGPALSAQWGGVRALCTLAAGGTTATALAQFQAWATSVGLSPATAASYKSLWDGATGLEFQGRNTRVLWRLRAAYIAAGDTTNQALVESYINAYADGVVLMETASGGAGVLKLRSGSASGSWNASMAGLSALAASLAIASNAGRQTVFDRILSAVTSGIFSGPVWSYDSTTNPIQVATTHYAGFHLYELARAKKILPATTLPPGDLVNYLIEHCTPDGIADEWRSNLLYRRGRASTQYFTAAVASMLNSDHAAAVELLRHVTTQIDPEDDTSLIDGWSSTETGDTMMDVTAVIDAAYWS